MTKTIAKTNIFGVPSPETTGRIEDSDRVSDLAAAHYRCQARMRELECQFEAKASEIRSAFVCECAQIVGVDA
jgi:hypothetical protein